MGVFDFLKRKRDNDLLDLTHKRGGEGDVPIPSDIKQRIEADIAISSIKATKQMGAIKPAGAGGAGERQHASDEPASGGFASFFKKASSDSGSDKIRGLGDKLSKLEQRVELL